MSKESLLKFMSDCYQRDKAGKSFDDDAKLFHDALNDLLGFNMDIGEIAAELKKLEG